MTTLQSKLEAGEFVITAEITPPLSASAGDLMERVMPLEGLVDAINVTDAPGARATMSSTAAAAIMFANGFEPVLQLTCRDRNRIGMACDLLGAAAQGARNLLILHGDDPSGGDQPDAKPVYDLDSRGVMALARTMRDDAKLPSGRQIKSPPEFFIGCADSPFDPPDDFTPKSLAAKIESGAQFSQTQFCYDVDVAARYFAALRDHGITDKLGFIVGIGPLLSAKSARWMDENLFGVTVPGHIIERLDGADDEKTEGRAICVEAIHGLKDIPGVCGVHIMAPQQGASAVAETIKMTGLR
jgi:methylenetetrahydrofolate reductase (NADPH)